MIENRKPRWASWTATVTLAAWVSVLSHVPAFGFDSPESPLLESTRDWKLVRDIPNPDFDTVQFSPAGDRFLLTNEAKICIDVFETSTGGLVAQLKTDQKTLASHGRPKAYSPDGTRIATGGVGPALQVWDAKTLVLLRTINEGASPPEEEHPLNEFRGEFNISSLDWSPDSTRILASAADEAIVWDAKSFKVIGTLHGHSIHIEDARYSPRGDLIATVGYDSTVRLWDGKENTSLGILRGHPGFVACLAWSPTGNQLATGGIATRWIPGRVLLWDIKTRKIVHKFDHSYDISSIRFSSDGKRLESFDEYIMKIWDMETGRRLLKVDRSGYMFANAAYSPDRKHLIVSGKQTVGIWRRQVP